ncbi:MAG: matrixin family metalloprotease [Clostridiales bacterium]|nr:matrixin family metalloprotease [Clostridiales bacterium]
MRRKFFALIFVGFLTVILSVAVNANPDGPRITNPIQYSEHKIGSDVKIYWKAPDSKYGSVDHYVISIRKFYTKENVNNSSSGSLIVDNIPCPKLTTSCTISGSMLEKYYLESTADKKYRKYRISVCAVMEDGTKRWSNHQYFYISAHNTPADKPISFHIYNGFTTDSKNQVYYACQNWNNKLDIGREIVNTYPFTMGTNDIDVNLNDRVNIVTKSNLKATGGIMTTYIIRNSDYKLRESDIMVNSYHSWANSSQPEKYNFYNAITHEIGHVVGLTDKYDSWATEWTMYGYADYNEDKKITLTLRDIANGISLYD